MIASLSGASGLEMSTNQGPIAREFGALPDGHLVLLRFQSMKTLIKDIGDHRGVATKEIQGTRQSPRCREPGVFKHGTATSCKLTPKYKECKLP